MDYMVFLMSRIREEHVHGLKTREAVEHGIAAIGRVIVAAAIIMGTVFAAFILTSDRISKEFGLLLAVAILTDALIVKMTLVPPFLTLMGEKSWYIPRWLDRLLPNITIEPPHDGEAPLRSPFRGPSRAKPDRRAGGAFGLRPPYADEAVEPVPHGGRDRREVGTQAVIAGHRHHRSQRRAGRHAEQVALALDDERRHPDGVELGEPALARAFRRRGAEARAGTRGRERRPRRSASAVLHATRAPDERPPVNERHVAELFPRAAARRPRATPRRAGARGAGLRRPRRGTAARRAPRSTSCVERSFGGRGEVARRHAAARAVTEHEPRARLSARRRCTRAGPCGVSTSSIAAESAHADEFR